MAPEGLIGERGPASAGERLLIDPGSGSSERPAGSGPSREAVRPHEKYTLIPPFSAENPVSPPRKTP